jgi:hypothetical protein
MPEKHRSLLFVSDVGTDDVYMYTLPGLALKGTLTGFNMPEGECSDNDGNVWVTNSAFGTQQIVKISHSGTILNILSDPSGEPVGCAVDPTTGNLAVTNLADLSGGGELLIYPNASGTPTAYTNPAQFSYYFAGYDSSGNLFEDGFAYEEGFAAEPRSDVNLNYLPFILSELPKGSSSLETISIIGCAHDPQCGPVYFPGMVEWYSPGNYLAVGDQLCGYTSSSCIYWVSISGTSGTITGATTMLGSAGNPICDLGEGVILPQTKDIVGSDIEARCGFTAPTTYRWRFPAGGSPKKYNANPSYNTPVGAAVSTKP